VTEVLEVWAPKARAVDVVVGERRTAMDGPDERGWFRTGAASEIDTGADYAFSLDGGPPLPDPRSPWQPDGVHGPSRRVDHGAFAWTDAEWATPDLADVVVYELHVGTFSPEGTFDGAIARLDHLVDLGITAVEVMPVAEFPGRRGWGYDGVHLWAPHSAYGGPDGFKRLVDACHARDLAVVLDVVYNHLGPDGNYLPQFGPYFSDRSSTPWGEAVNFDGPDSDDVRAFVVDNACMWVRDYHVDGLRLHAVLTGERTGYYADFGSLAQLAKALRQAYVYDGCRSQHRRRRHGRPPTGVAATSFFGFAQNHDQVGNRATGERSAALMGTGRLKIAAALVLCSPFVPMLFQGEEWAASTPFQYFTDHGDAELGRAVSEGRRREFEAFGWSPDDVPDPQDPETFRRSRLDWDELDRAPHAEILAWHRELIRLRREVPALAGTDVGVPDIRFDEAAGWLVLQRGPLSVVCNLSDAEQSVPLGDGDPAVVAAESVLIVG